MSDSIDIQEVKNWKEFERELALLGEQIRQQIELEVEAFATDPEAMKERRERCLFDYQFFCQTYFPHYVPTAYFSDFHRFIFKRLPACIDSDRDAREVHEAPRGEAKSTYETQLGLLWCICRAVLIDEKGGVKALGLPAKARKHMMGIIMNTEEQAAEMLESIKAELDTNPRLMMDFPECTGSGKKWQSTTAITNNNIKVRIGGTSKKIRGMKHGPHRPDAIFLDDLENDENVKVKAQRDKIEDVVLKAVIGLAGPGGGMDVFYVGTSLHYDAAINRVSRKPGWRRQIFRSIVKWPDRMDLWDQWEALYTRSGEDDEKEQFEAEALAFYLKNKIKMDAGAVCSWPEVRPLYRLMCMRATDHDAFSQEQQNEAGNDENAPFKNIQFWVNRLADWIFFGAIDPSLGKKGTPKGDPSAILVGGLDRKTMILDVVEADICKRVPDLIITRAIDYQIEYQCLAWAVETVQFQFFLHTQLIKEAARRSIAFPGIPVQPDTDKALRIISLQPHINNGLIRLHRNQSTMTEQLKFWPEATHDDGPDALEMLHKIAMQFGGEFKYTSAGGSRSQRRSTSRGNSDYDEDWDDD